MFYSIQLKPFKKLYIGFTLAYIFTIGLAYLMVKSGFQLNLNWIGVVSVFTSLIIAGAALASFFMIRSLRSKKNEINKTEMFEKKVKLYIAYYKQKLVWNYIVGSVTCVLFVMTGTISFLYLSILYLVYVLSYFPKKETMKRDLDCNEIEFI